MGKSGSIPRRASEDGSLVISLMKARRLIRKGSNGLSMSCD